MCSVVWLPSLRCGDAFGGKGCPRATPACGCPPCGALWSLGLAPTLGESPRTLGQKVPTAAAVDLPWGTALRAEKGRGARGFRWLPLVPGAPVLAPTGLFVIAKSCTRPRRVGGGSPLLAMGSLLLHGVPCGWWFVSPRAPVANSMGLTLPPRLRGPSWPKGFVLFLGLRVACGGVQGPQRPPLALPHPCSPASSLQGERLSPVAVQWCLCTCRCVCGVCGVNAVSFFLAWEGGSTGFSRNTCSRTQPTPCLQHSFPPTPTRSRTRTHTQATWMCDWWG